MREREFTRQFGDILDFDVGKAPDENHLNLTRLQQMGHPADLPPSFSLYGIMLIPISPVARKQRSQKNS